MIVEYRHGHITAALCVVGTVDAIYSGSGHIDEQRPARLIKLDFARQLGDVSAFA
jgi:hypothetical protein